MPPAPKHEVPSRSIASPNWVYNLDGSVTAVEGVMLFLDGTMYPDDVVDCKGTWGPMSPHLPFRWDDTLRWAAHILMDLMNYDVADDTYDSFWFEDDHGKPYSPDTLLWDVMGEDDGYVRTIVRLKPDGKGWRRDWPVPLPFPGRKAADGTRKDAKGAEPATKRRKSSDGDRATQLSKSTRRATKRPKPAKGRGRFKSYAIKFVRRDDGRVVVTWGDSELIVPTTRSFARTIRELAQLRSLEVSTERGSIKADGEVVDGRASVTTALDNLENWWGSKTQTVKVAVRTL